MPIFGAAGEEAPEPEVRGFELVNVDDGEVALATGGDIEAEAVLGFGIEEFGEVDAEEAGDGVFAIDLAFGAELAELLDDLVVFEVEAGEVVVVTAAFDGAPVHDVIGGGAEGVAEVGLLEDFLMA